MSKSSAKGHTMPRTRKLKSGRVIKIKGQAPTWAGQGSEFLEGFGQSRNK
jgi:hypothetical protein